ncbi:DUF4145 domain-containing protein [Chromobacterium vaccinii]|uniref:DUF4145 domain-containing protein n=1 Tax=Chromobacterium vaccinii TaxID=1108595 RepID=UPI001E2C120E|nr:DUF4145 domain-containing protein [Chromobacterium vaccinii]MCD4501077.1 DUF4145 domain-containing protein [Chromobacterium vaccinii]
MDYVPPSFNADGYNCPFCKAYAHVRWIGLYNGRNDFIDENITQAQCSKCSKSSIWRGTPVTDAPRAPFTWEMIFPRISSIPMPSEDLPEQCKADYMEARDIAAQSPRAAAALLRLLVEKLAQQFGEPGNTIDKNIGLMVQKGLPEKLQKAFDSVRVIGNAAVHPGIMDVEDNPEVVTSLFRLVNIIVEKMITEPKEIDAVFELLPDSRKAGIAARDTPKT